MQQRRRRRGHLVSTALRAAAGIAPVLLVLGAGALAPGRAAASILALQNGEIELSVALPDGTFVSAPALGQAAPAQVMVSSGTGGFALPAGLFQGAEALPPSLFTGVPLISSLAVTASNAAGSFAAGLGPASGFGGAMALEGQIVVGLLGGLVDVTAPLTPIGGGGVGQASGILGLMVTLSGAPWTTGPATVTGVTLTTSAGAGFVNTVTLAGLDARTAGHAGVLRLVSPTRILLSDGEDGLRLPAFASLQLEFVPEPGILVLWLAAAAGVGLARPLGRRRD